MSTSNPVHYDRTTIALHWLTAVLVAGLWIAGQLADSISDRTLREFVWSNHVVFGFGLAAILIWRIAWRFGRHESDPPPADRGVLDALAKATHSGLYLLLAVVLILGIANAVVRGYGIYGLLHLPQVGDRALRRPLTNLHGLGANIVMALAGFHAAAALVHHYLWRDGLLGRMIPWTAFVRRR